MVMVHSMAITLLRHGLTEANERKAYLGWTDSPLSEGGKADIQALAGCFDTYEHIISSDLPRCVTTAQLLFPTASIISDSAFREMNWGLWEGKTYEQLKEDSYYQTWLENPMKADVPEGESYPVFSERIREGWRNLNIGKVENIVIMTHGGVVRELLARYAPEEKSFWDWQIPHAGGYELFWNDKEAWRRGERCTSLRVVPIMEKQNG
ncbi:histidine phosphatase family protein [Peribacillus asahii]|nr:histidine phosphatase family protein [Peribacillus asahii]USK85061.1 histidine phosphatase family protein [Peribacillus asahii]